MNNICPILSMGKETLLECTSYCTFYDNKSNCLLENTDKLIQDMKNNIDELSSTSRTLNGLKDDLYR